MENLKEQCSSPLLAVAAAGSGSGASSNQSFVVDIIDDHNQIQECRICLETTGRDFIAPCNCSGTSKFVHRECLDSWRAEKEGFAFAHCTTCQAAYYLTAHDAKKWQIFKFRFFVARDILLALLAVELVIFALAALVYGLDALCKFRLHHILHFAGATIFYYICGVVLFLAALGLGGCCVTIFSIDVGGQSSRSDGLYGTNTMLYVGDCNCCPRGASCCDGGAGGCICCPGGTTCCDGGAGDCNNCCPSGALCCCNGGGNSSGDDGAVPAALVCCLVLVVVFAVVGLFYGAMMATMIGWRIWERHQHILVKRIVLTKEYVVEDAAAARMKLGENTAAPGLPAEHVERLKLLGLLSPPDTSSTDTTTSVPTTTGSVIYKPLEPQIMS